MGGLNGGKGMGNDTISVKNKTLKKIFKKDLRVKSSTIK